MAKKSATKKSSSKTKNLKETEIVVVLDRSGSMASIAAETVDGFNKFLVEQQNAEGDAFITLVQFDDRYEINYSGANVKQASPLILGESFKPRGSTALFDAIGRTIEEVKTERDVVFVIITDGEENASKTYTKEAIFKMIDTLQKEDNWKFIFLAANQDAIQAGNSIGISGNNSMTYAATSTGASKSWVTLSSNTANYRSSKAAYFSENINATADMFQTSTVSDSLIFTEEQRDEQKKEGA